MGYITMKVEGEAMTTTLRDLISSGSFYNAITVLKDSNLPKEMIKEFLLGEWKIIGEDNDMEMVRDNYDPQHEMLLTGWRTFMRENELEYYRFDDVREMLKYRDNEIGLRHLNTLLSVVHMPELKDILKWGILESINYKIFPLKDELPLESYRDGVITECGTFIECGFEGHYDLYQILKPLGISSSKKWGDDTKCLRISSCGYGGKMAYAMKYYREQRDVELTDEQIQAVVKWIPMFNNFYESKRTVAETIMNMYSDKLGYGRKYGYLTFLKRFYGVLTPNIYTTPPKGRYAVRTSLKYPKAGLMDSHFDVTEYTHDDVLLSINKQYVSYGSIFDHNELNVFYQEQLVGENGVAHYKEKGDFDYSMSEKRGAIVGGAKGSRGLSPNMYMELRTLCRDLYQYIKKMIQLEFVVSDEKLYIVELKIMETPTKDEIGTPKGLIGSGRSFTSGEVECDIEDVLIIDTDITDPKELIGKKALIVKSDVDFSHALALSQHLNIPSLYNLYMKGGKELPNNFIISTINRTAHIIKQ